MVEIEVAPNLFSGGLTLSWHGVFSFLAVATAVILVARWAPLRGVDPDDVYSIAIWAIIGGLIGTRLVHVIDHWDFYGNNLSQIPIIWRGGVAVWGGVLGGFIGGVSYTLVENSLRRRRREAASRTGSQGAARTEHMPIGVISDMTAPAMLLVQTIGRLGDIVNGEHCAKAATDWFIGFTWTHPNTLAAHCANGFVNSAQPAILYEMVSNLLILAVVWRLWGRLKPDGMIFALYLALYAAGRFLITFSRSDNVWTLGLQEAQLISLGVLAITVPLLVARARLVPREQVVVQPAAPRGTRAERRRRR